jgi:hypothetical protein
MPTHPTPRQTRRQEAARKHSQRAAAERRRRLRVRLGWAAAGIVALGLLAFAIWSTIPRSTSAGPVIDGVQCNTSEQLAYHIHQHLAIYDAGQPVTVPEGIGIDQKNNCIYWLHTHDTTGVIHVESPSQKQYTLGTFFDIWGQKIDGVTFLTHGIAAGHSVRAYTGSSVYHGDPRNILVTPHKLVTLEYGPPWVAPDTTFKFPNGE